MGKTGTHLYTNTQLPKYAFIQQISHLIQTHGIKIKNNAIIIKFKALFQHIEEYI